MSTISVVSSFYDVLHHSHTEEEAKFSSFMDFCSTRFASSSLSLASRLAEIYLVQVLTDYVLQHLLYSLCLEIILNSCIK